MMFDCDKCGECCRNLKYSELYKELDSGNGECKFLIGNLCSIYENRPVICRIDDMYDLCFSGAMTKEEYYEENYKICKKLKEKEGE